jgi:hypothetical protein
MDILGQEERQALMIADHVEISFRKSGANRTGNDIVFLFSEAFLLNLKNEMH